MTMTMIGIFETSFVGLIVVWEEEAQEEILFIFYL